MNRTKFLLVAPALATIMAISGCVGGVATNRSLDSMHEPVVRKTTYTLDVTTGYDGLPISEQRRLDAWFESINLGFADTVSLDEPTGSSAARASVQSVADRHGVILAAGVPVTPGAVPPGSARVIVMRSVASVDGCPDWRTKTDGNPNNATSPGYGCAVNGNLAAMVANPDDLVHGQTGTGDTVVMSSDKAIAKYREAAKK